MTRQGATPGLSRIFHGGLCVGSPQSGPTACQWPSEAWRRSPAVSSPVPVCRSRGTCAASRSAVSTLQWPPTTACSPTIRPPRGGFASPFDFHASITYSLLPVSTFLMASAAAAATSWSLSFEADRSLPIAAAWGCPAVIAPRAVAMRSRAAISASSISRTRCRCTIPATSAKFRCPEFAFEFV